MAIEARELEAFLKSIEGQEALAQQAEKLAGKLEDAGITRITRPAPKIELPRSSRRETLHFEAPLSRGDLVDAFREKNIYLTSWAQELIERIDLTNQAPDMSLVWLSGRDLGLRRASPYLRFLEAGQSAGYNLLHPEVGLYLRLQDTEQPLGDLYWIAMKPVADRSGRPSVFALAHDESGLWLDAAWVNPSDRWIPDGRLVFSLSK